jgi:hypothetical protein
MFSWSRETTGPGAKYSSKKGERETDVSTMFAARVSIRCPEQEVHPQRKTRTAICSSRTESTPLLSKFIYLPSESFVRNGHDNGRKKKAMHNSECVIMAETIAHGRKKGHAARVEYPSSRLSDAKSSNKYDS